MLMEYSPIIFTIGKFDIRWYSLFILVAFVLAYYLVVKETSRFRISRDFIFNIAFWIFIFGIIGARTWYVLFNIEDYTTNPLNIFKIWEGGLAIHGGIVAGLLVIFYFCRRYKFRFIRLTDFIAPALLIAQAIGRWGNFFNAEAYGLKTTAETLSKYFIPDFIIKGMTINGDVYTPTFLFESLACFVLFILIVLVRRSKYLKVGSLTAFYLIGYGIIRFLIEFERLDALKVGGIRVAQVISAIFFTIGLSILVSNSKKSKLDDLYNDTQNVPDLKF
jgi:phosphatidylglycerol:prolipoprotein diacylglycerol transferase